ncbi:hypothetical protein ACF0H5_001046 [Mactra antiquata]
MTATNGNVKQEEQEEKKPGTVRKVSKITFTIGPIRQEDLSTPAMNKLMAMAQRFDISFDTVSILDSDQTDKLGYITLPFEIRTQEYLLVLYDRLTNLKLSPSRDVSVKFPDELKNHVEEVRLKVHEEKKQKIEEDKQKAEKLKRSLFATWVDKDTGKASLEEKFPEAKEITLRQHNFQWFGCIEFETLDDALQTLKKSNQLEIEGQKVKLVRSAPDQAEDKKPSLGQNRKRANTGGSRSGGGMHSSGPKPLLSSPINRGSVNRGMGFGGGYRDYNSGYAGGYGQQGFTGNFQLGAKRKTDLGDFGGAAKKPYGMRGGYGGGGRGRGGGMWGGR